MKSFTVEVLPPDGAPAWMGADSSISADGLRTKQIVVVFFNPLADQSQRQAAVDSVGGTLVGGLRLGGGDGYYYLQVADSGQGLQLDSAVQKLSSLVQVAMASLDYRILSPAYLRPSDGAGWKPEDWSIAPANAEGANWALEAIAAPFAWGCSTGSPETKVAILDDGFDSTEIFSNVSYGASLLGSDPLDTLRHGTSVANMVGARGNDGFGITGVMWRSGLRLVDISSSSAQAAQSIYNEGATGTRIVNLSSGIGWMQLHQAFPDVEAYDPWSHPDLARALTYRILAMMMPALRKAQSEHALPLVVLSAGNDFVDASLGLAALRDSFPDNILTVGSSDIAGTVGGLSDSGPYVDLFAPGEGVTSYRRIAGVIAIGSVNGTSFAAPIVAGIAGLLKAFDPSLGPDTLRSLVLRGARKGGRHVISVLDTTYIANAYESLKLAGERRGAPLCGNKVWIENRQVVAQRGTQTEVLAQLDPSWYGAYLNLKHGGHRFEVDYGNAFVFNGTTRAWDYVEDGGDPSTLDGAMFSSYNGSSHDGDVWVGGYTSNNSSTHEKSVVLTVYEGTSNRELTTLHFPYTVPGSQCGRKVGQEIVINEDETGFHGYTITDGIYMCEDSTAVGSWTEVAVNGSYPFISPDGENLLIPVDTWANSASAGNTFVRCDSTGVQDTNGLWLSTCLTSTITRQLVKTDVYEIPLHGTLPTNIEQNPKWTIANRGIYWMALSEDNKEFGAGFETLSTSVFTGTGTNLGFGSSKSPMDCTNEYRSSYRDTIAFGTLLRWTSSYGPNGVNDCWVDAGSGISPTILVGNGFSTNGADAIPMRARPSAGRSSAVRRFGITRQASSNVQNSRRVLLPYSAAYKVPGTLWSIDAKGKAHLRPSRSIAAKKLRRVVK